MDEDARTKLLDGKDCIYLQDSGVEIEGFKLWGIPWTPKFYNWAFMKNKGGEIGVVVNKIPNDTDILITHGPPFGRLDFTKNDRISSTYDEHGQIIKAIIAGRSAEAQRLLKAHIEQSKIEVRKITLGMLQDAKKMATG